MFGERYSDCWELKDRPGLGPDAPIWGWLKLFPESNRPGSCMFCCAYAACCCCDPRKLLFGSLKAPR